jgi:peptidoglycan-N-acetylglucosamine deacetylase
MLKEYHYDHLIRWPKGERACVFLTFDFQGGEDVKPDKNGILNYEMWSQGEYGPHHAIYRLLRILKEENVKATFLTCGAIAERFPDAVQAILDHGHVVEGHGYNHEIARYLPRDQEDTVMKRADPAAHWTAAAWLALLHAEHQHPRAADRERLHLQHQLLP